MPDAAAMPMPATSGPLGYVLAVAGSALAVLVAALTERWLGLDDLSLVFMLAVLVVAARTHTGPAVLTAVLCFLAYNFFFIEPRYTFYISARHGVATVALFLAAALLAGRLASRLAMQVQALRAAGRHAAARQELARRLTVAASEEEVLQAAQEMMRDSLRAEAWIQVAGSGLEGQAGAVPPEAVLRQVAEGRRAETVEEHGWWFLPLHAPDRLLGVVGLKLPSGAGGLDAAERQLARTMVDDIAQALQRTRLVAALQSERVAAETERLRSALLSSVSHDLRTPLAGVIGAAEALESYGADMEAGDRRSLLATIREEGQRLDGYIQNLLDMTRLGQGGMALRRDWIGADELLGATITRLQRHRPDARFQVVVEPGLGPLRVNPALLGQALYNVLDNAAKFSPTGALVEVRVHRAGPDAAVQPDLCIDVRDRGPGIPAAERGRVFDAFYSMSRGDRGRDGTGLGLAICRGVIEAHGGTIAALPADGGGTCMRITLPMPAPGPDAESGGAS